jgi:hypothetical protein
MQPATQPLIKFIRENYVIITLILLALFNVLIHVTASFNLEYHRDELLYFSLGRHPAAGYETVPPMTGWVAWLMQNIFGYSLFAVRIFPAILSGAMVFLIAALAKELGGSDYSRILAAIGSVAAIFSLRTFLLFQPVHIDLIFWTLSFYLVVKYVNTLSGKYLILLGITVGLAFLNKYLIGLLFFSFLIIIPFTKHRNLFSNRYFWYGILAGILIFLPNIIWQIANGLPVIGHMAELKSNQLVNVDRAAFLVEQVMIPGAASVLTIAGLLFLLFNMEAAKYRFIALVALTLVLILMLLQGKSYYTQGIFPFLIAAGAVVWEKLLRKAWLKMVLILIIILFTLPVLPIGLPVYKTERLIEYFDRLTNDYGMDFVTRFEDNSIHSLPQDYADMLGWEELAASVNKAWQKVQDKEAGFIYCENYGQAGAVTVIGKKYGLPDPVSFHESFKYWLPDLTGQEIKSVIYVNDEMGEDVKSLFRKITIEGSISNPDAREFGTNVYLCEDPSSSFNEFWVERIREID